MLLSSLISLLISHIVKNIFAVQLFVYGIQRKRKNERNKYMFTARETKAIGGCRSSESRLECRKEDRKFVIYVTIHIIYKLTIYII